MSNPALLFAIVASEHRVRIAAADRTLRQRSTAEPAPRPRLRPAVRIAVLGQR